MNKLKKLIIKINNYFRWGDKGKKVKIIKPIRILGKNNVYIGNNVCIRNGARIETIENWKSISYNPKIVIGNNVNIQQNIHMTCANRIVIEDGVNILANCVITDIEHIYEKNRSVNNTGIKCGSIYIKENVTIGNGTTILAGNKDIVIGKNAVIGANSVVTKSIPDYAIAVGSPAQIKKYLD